MTEVMKMRCRQYAYYRDHLFNSLKGENSLVDSIENTGGCGNGTL